MKTILLTVAMLASVGSFAQDRYEYKIITTVESIVPMGIGRSRIIENNGNINADELTTERTDGTDSKQKEVKRRDAKIDDLNETKLLNFFSIAGINFQNIASNDAIITSKLNNLVKQGW
jgi:hypothetical protein